MDNFSPDPALPLTEAERAHHQAKAEKGDYPSLDIVRRFVATIRKSILTTPKLEAKTKVSRVKKPVISEDDVNF